MPPQRTIAGVCLLVATACTKRTPMDSEPEKSTPELVAETKAFVSSLDVARRAALAGAASSLVPREDLGACPVKFDPIFGVDPPPSPFKGRDGVPRRERKAWGGYDIGPYDPREDGSPINPNTIAAIDGIGIAFASEVASKPGPRATQFFGAERSPAAWLLRDLMRLDRNENDFELVIDRELPPHMTGPETFAPGVLLGRFYVWSNAKRAIVCAANVAVQSSEALNVEYRGPAGTVDAGLELAVGAGLRSDLREQAFAEARRHLSLVGPPRVDAGSPQTDAGSKTDAGPKRK